MKPLHSSSASRLFQPSAFRPSGFSLPSLRLFQPSAFRLSGFSLPSLRLFQPSAFRLSGFLFLLASSLLLPAQEDPVLITGSTGYQLNAADGHYFYVPAGYFMTNLTAGANAAIYDTAAVSSEAWVIRNAGRIGEPFAGSGANGIPYFGIYLNSTGSSTVINEIGGLIRGNRTNNNSYGSAIVSMQGHLTIINAGELYGRMTTRFYRGGILYNSGYIHGSNFPVLFNYLDNVVTDNDFQGLVVNTGTIHSTGGYIMRLDYPGIIVRNIGGLLLGELGVDNTATAGIRYQMSDAYFENTDGGLMDIVNAAVHALEMQQGGTIAITSGTVRLYAAPTGNTILISGGAAYSGGHITIGADGAVIRESTGLPTTANMYAINVAASTKLFLENYGKITADIRAINMNNAAGNLIINHEGAIISSGGPGARMGISGTLNQAITQGAASSGTILNYGLIEGGVRGIGVGGGLTIHNYGTIAATGTLATDPTYAITFAGANTSWLYIYEGSSIIGNMHAGNTTSNVQFQTGNYTVASSFANSAGNGLATVTKVGAGNTTLNGSYPIAGSSTAALRVAAGGTLTLLNAFTFFNAAAAVQVQGQLVLGDGASISGTGSNTPPRISIDNGGLLVFDRSTALTHAGAITGSGGVLKNGAANVTLTGANSYRDTTINAGAITGVIGSGILTVNASGTFAATASATVASLLGSGRVEMGAYNLTFNVASGLTPCDFTGVLAGTGTLVKTGSGSLDLAAATTFGLPAASIQDGSIRLSAASQISAASISLGAASTRGIIDYTGSAPWAKNLSLDGLGGGLSIDSASVSLTATVTGAGDFVKAGAGTLDITAASMNNTGDTIVTGGLLRGDTATIMGDTSVASGATIEFAQASNATYSGVISGVGSLLKSGAGDLTLAAANSYGDTTVTDGLLIGNIGRGTLTVDSPGSYRMGAFSNVTLTGILGDGTIDMNNNDFAFDVAAGVTGSFDFAGTLLNTADFIKTGAGTLALANTLSSASVLISDGAVRLDSQAKFGPASISLGAASTRGLIDYTGSTPWSKDLALAGLGGGFSIASGVASLTATITGAGDFVKAGAGSLDITAASMNNTGDTIVTAGLLRGNAATIKGDTSVASGATIEFNQTANATYSGLISGAGSLLKSGAGDLTLSAANSYGDTLVTAGLLAGNIGKGTLTVDSSGTYRMGANSSVTLAGILGNGTIDLNNNDLAFDVAAGLTGTFSFQGALINGRDFIKSGAGTLVLLNTLSNSAALVNDGAVRIDSQDKFGSASISLGSASTRGLIDYTGSAPWSKNLALTGLGGGFFIDSGTTALTATVTGAGDFVKAGAGALDITAASMNNTGNTLVTAGLLRGDAATIRGDTAISAGASLEFAQTADGSYAGNISGAGSLLKTGAGELALSGSNTYGDTTITEGVLVGSIGAGLLEIQSQGTYRVQNGQATYTTSGVSGDGTLDLNQADLAFDIAGGVSTFSFNGHLAGSGNNRFVKTGAGTLDLQTTAALPGGAAIEQGVVRLADQDFLNSEIVLGSDSSEGFLEYTGADPWAKDLRLAGAGGGFLVATDDVHFTGAVSGDALFIKDGARELFTHGATFSNAGGALVRAGRLTGDSASMPLAVETALGAAVSFVQHSDGAYNGILTGEGAFFKAGPATLTLAHPVQYTAQTSIEEGTLRAGAANLWLHSSSVTIAPAGALDTGGFNQSIFNLANNGAVILNATVNSMAGIIYATDKLTVTTAATGTGRLLVSLHDATPASPDSADWPSSAIVFELTGAGVTDYSPGLVERHVAGAYEWSVARSADGRSYILSTDKYSPEIPAVGGIDLAAYLTGEAAVGSLGRRLMAAREEKAEGGHSFQVWANGLYRHDTLGNDLYDNARAMTSGLQAGADWNNFSAGEGVPATIGFFCDTAWTETDFARNLNNNIRPWSKTDSNGFGLYASYRPGIFYIDAIIRTSREKYEIRVPGTPSFRTRGRGTALSVEGGILLNGPLSWKIEPQLQIIAQTHRVDSTSDSLGRAYDIDSASTREARVGARLWREFVYRDGKSRFIPHLRASFLYDWDGKGAITVSPSDPSAAGSFESRRFDNSIGSTLFILDAGATCVLNRWCSLGFAMNWSSGIKLEGFGGNATLTLRW